MTVQMVQAKVEPESAGEVQEGANKLFAAIVE